jgi:hypothetical protein
VAPITLVPGHGAMRQSGSAGRATSASGPVSKPAVEPARRERSEQWKKCGAPRASLSSEEAPR